MQPLQPLQLSLQRGTAQNRRRRSNEDAASRQRTQVAAAAIQVRILAWVHKAAMPCIREQANLECRVQWDHLGELACGGSCGWRPQQRRLAQAGARSCSRAPPASANIGRYILLVEGSADGACLLLPRRRR